MVQIIRVKVVPNAKKDKVLADAADPAGFKVYVHAPAVEGKANKAVLEILAAHFNVRKSAIRLVRGEKGRTKVFEIGS